MHVVVTTQPAYGHLHPLVPLCRALVDAGHGVTIVSSRSFLPQMQRTGLDATPAGVDWLESDIAGGFPEYAEHRVRGDSKWFLQSEVFGWHTALAMADDLVAYARDHAVDLVIREPWEFGGALAAATLGIPCIVHGIGSLANVDEVLEIAGPRLGQHAKRLGLSDSPAEWLAGELYLDPCPPCLQAETSTFAPTRSCPIRPAPFDTTDGTVEALDWIHALGTRPVIYVGLGTVMNRWHGLLERIVGELHGGAVDLVVTTGPGFEATELGHQPANVRVERYVPLTALLPKCDVVVCHAGWGTTIAALSFGKPLVTIPLGADGPRTAAKCEAAGFGRTIAHDSVGDGSLAQAVTEVVENRTFHLAAQSAQDQIRAMPSAAELVALIEDVQRAWLSPR